LADALKPLASALVGTLSTGAGADVVGPYLAAALGDPAWADCAVALISGGKSNLTYEVTSGAGRVVLRRPPLGSVLPTAHDMTREHRVISALAGSAVPVPRALHLCTDPAVLGAPFQVMEFVEGPVARDALPPGYADTPAERAAIARSLVATLAALHAIDPAAVGLAGFGRPEGYLRRQVDRWQRQWLATPGADSPEADALGAALADSLPDPAGGGIVHGDFRLDNTVLDPASPGRIAAVLDWEMSTLGDPLADLGLLLVYWSQDGDGPVRRAAARGSQVTRLDGFPSRDEVAELYAAASGRDLAQLPWYVAFGFFKLAVVVAGVAARHRAGAMVGAGFEGISEALVPLVELGHETLRTRSIG
jgi:aminoglycoside phosphotransferase (APT) family kinase protein